MEDGEEVPVVDVVVDLRPLALREDVLDVERVPAEALGEQLSLLLGRRVAVDPGQAAELELGDAPLLRRLCGREVARTARASDPGQARHRY